MSLYFEVHPHSKNEGYEHKSYYKFYSAFDEKSICEMLYNKYKILYATGSWNRLRF